MISNRESAKRSRMKKQQHLENLLSEKSRLLDENNQLVQKIDAITQLQVQAASENNILNAQVGLLTDRLQFLNDIIRMHEATQSHTHQFDTDIPAVQDLLLEPWQFPWLAPPMMTSSDTFQC